MKKSRFTEDQIPYALTQTELGMAVLDVCRKLYISEATLYSSKKKYGGLAPTDPSEQASPGD